MDKSIAVILDKEGRIASLQEGEKIIQYNKEGQNWIVKKEVPVRQVFTGGVQVVRKNLEGIIRELSGCSILAGKAVTGLVYQVFDIAGYIISELLEFSPNILEELYQKIADETSSLHKEQEEVKKIPTAPIKTEVEGCYFFDFSLLKNSDTPYSSKSTIIPFLNTTVFKRLDIISDHVMPWLEAELIKRNLYFETEKADMGKVKIIIRPVH